MFDGFERNNHFYRVVRQWNLLCAARPGVNTILCSSVKAGRFGDVDSDHVRGSCLLKGRGAVTFSGRNVQDSFSGDKAASESITVYVLPECHATRNLGHHPLAGVVVQYLFTFLCHIPTQGLRLTRRSLHSRPAAHCRKARTPFSIRTM